jgi:hypothetical protein
MSKALNLAGLIGLLGIIVTAPLPAAEVAGSAQVRVPQIRLLPYPRETRAEAVWNERTCWSQCGAYCAWGMAACLKQETQGTCLKLTDRCDRACQRECRTSGGPFVPDLFDALN